MPTDPRHLAILLCRGAYDSAHATFMLAAAAAALNQRVTVFAMGAGVRALARDWSRLEGATEDTLYQHRGVPGLDELRDACRDLGVALWACPTGLVGEALTQAELSAGVSENGLASFLEATREARFISP